MRCVALGRGCLHSVIVRSEDGPGFIESSENALGSLIIDLEYLAGLLDLHLTVYHHLNEAEALLIGYHVVVIQ